MRKWLKNYWWSNILCFFSNNISAQYLNFVPDGSFEDTTQIWQNWTGGNCLTTWFNLGNNPVSNEWYYCNINKSLGASLLGLPVNSFFSQYPRNGLGAVMLQNYADTSTTQIPLYWFIRSILKNKLTKKLIAGKEYCATLYVVADERATGVHYTNGLAMYFDNGDLDTIYTKHKDSLGVYTFVQPQVQCPFVINDTVNWMKLQGTFIANGTETTLTIGNFLPDNGMLVLPSPPPLFIDTFKRQAVLIDDVSLIPTDISNWLPNANATAGDDSVWVGLDKFDYPDGKWYTLNGNYITTGPGFWQKPVEAGVQYIHEIDICGVKKYDTLEVVVTPLNINNSIVKNEISIIPNPNTGNFQVITSVPNNSLRITNLMGNIVYQSLDNTNQYNIQLNAPNGLYFLQTTNSKGELNAQFIIEK
jgi:hypothetical protein